MQKDINSAIENYYQIGLYNDLHLYNILDVFTTMTVNHGFNQLRTIEQLGYMVYVTYRIDNGVMGYRVLIQSNVKAPDYVDDRIETWISSLESYLNDMSGEEFENYINGIISAALEKDKSLKQEFDRQRTEISHPHTYEFERKEKNVEILKQIKKEDIIKFYHTYIKSKSPLRRKLSSQVYGKDDSIKDEDKYYPMPQPKENIILIPQDFQIFKRESILYSLVYNRSDF